MNTPLLQREPVEAGGVTFDTVVLGAGEPTVVFVNGLGSPLEEWALVTPAIAERCRVVCYDRRQAAPKGPLPVHDASQIAGDLHELLASLGVDGPLVLVGHSWGGAAMRRYAFDHPSQVAGMVYVDASHEGMKAMSHPPRITVPLYTASTAMLRVGPIRRRLLGTLGFERLGPQGLKAVAALPWVAKGRTARAEFASVAPSLRELAQIAPALPDVPTRVLLAAGRPGLTAKLGAKQLATVRAAWETAVADRADVTVEAVADSGHYIPLDQPQAVIAAVEDLVREVSAGRVR